MQHTNINHDDINFDEKEKKRSLIRTFCVWLLIHLLFISRSAAQISDTSWFYLHKINLMTTEVEILMLCRHNHLITVNFYDIVCFCLTAVLLITLTTELKFIIFVYFFSSRKNFQKSTKSICGKFFSYLHFFFNSKKLVQFDILIE
jgi:hypothetical protein